MVKRSFEQYDLSKELIKAISLLNYHCPTKVQDQVIPLMLEEKDIIVKSQTGSGKTAAFAIPICELIKWDENKPQALVITPTRELALQIKEDMFNIGRFRRLKVSAVYGKSPFYYQELELKQKTHIVVGTPGRLNDHLEKRTLDPSQLRYVVIDEADELLNMGFIEQVESILSRLPLERITILLSATMPHDIEKLCEDYLSDPIRVEIEEQSKTTDRIVQEGYYVEEGDKLKLLNDIMIVENPESSMIFCNTKHQVEEVYKALLSMDYPCARLHGGMEQRHRISVMSDFKAGYFRYLIATDVAARGIDVDDVALVINYDVPQDSEHYVHRIGRTGRLGKQGKAITFFTQEDEKYRHMIDQFTGKDILLKERPDRETVQGARPHFMNTIDTVPDLRVGKGAQLGKDITKIHINAGKKTKLRAVDVVGTLCNIGGMTAEDIGIINILDVSTYVEILNNKGDLVLEALQYKPIKGRLRKAHRVKT